MFYYVSVREVKRFNNKTGKMINTANNNKSRKIPNKISFSTSSELTMNQVGLGGIKLFVGECANIVMI